MRRIIQAVLLILPLLLTGCLAYKRPKPQDGRLKIVTTVFPAYDFARQVAGDNAEITMLLSPGSSGHGFEPTPQQMLDIKSSDVFIYIGGSDERWAEDTVRSGGADDSVTVRLADSAKLLWDDGEDDHDHGDTPHEDLFDPHIWTSVKNAELMLSAVCDAICLADNDNAEYYLKNKEEYAKQLAALDNEIKQAAAKAQNDTLIFADKFAFRYFTDEYGLKYMAAFHSCDEHSEPGAKTVARLIDAVREKSIPAVYYFEFNSAKTAEVISEETGAKAVMLYSCHTVSKQELAAGETYVSLMNKNLEQLKTGLGAG